MHPRKTAIVTFRPGWRQREWGDSRCAWRLKALLGDTSSPYHTSASHYAGSNFRLSCLINFLLWMTPGNTIERKQHPTKQFCYSSAQTKKETSDWASGEHVFCSTPPHSLNSSMPEWISVSVEMWFFSIWIPVTTALSRCTGPNMIKAGLMGLSTVTTCSVWGFCPVVPKKALRVDTVDLYVCPACDELSTS